MNALETRQRIINKARAEFIATGETSNISDAVRLYIAAHPEERALIPATITTREADRPKTIIDRYHRPECPTCAEELFLKPKCSGLQAGDYFYIWTCKKCGFEEYSDLTLPEILQTLKPKRNV